MTFAEWNRGVIIARYHYRIDPFALSTILDREDRRAAKKGARRYTPPSA